METQLPPDENRLYRPLWKYRLTYGSLGGFFLAMCIFLLVIPYEQSHWIWVAIGLLMLTWIMLFGVIVLLGIFTITLRLTPGGLEYGNVFSRIHARWEDIKEFALVNNNLVLLAKAKLPLDRKRWAFWMQNPSLSDGTYIPIYLFHPTWRSDFMAVELGRELAARMPQLFETHEVPDEEPAAPPDEPPPGLVVFGRYRFRSQRSIYIAMVILLVSPLVMAALGVFYPRLGYMAGWVAGWLVVQMIYAAEFRPTPLTDLVAFAAALSLGGISTLLSVGGCNLWPHAEGCAINAQRANILASFAFPLLMFFVMALMVRLPLIFRKLKGIASKK